MSFGGTDAKDGEISYLYIIGFPWKFHHMMAKELKGCIGENLRHCFGRILEAKMLSNCSLIIIQTLMKEMTMDRLHLIWHL